MSSIGSGAAAPSWHTALLVAVKKNDKTQLEELISEFHKEGDNPKLVLRHLLQHAASRGYHSIVELLLGKEAEVDPPENEVPALCGAAEWGHCSVMQLLLSKNANVEAKDKDQRTALVLAVAKFVEVENQRVALLTAPSKGSDIERKERDVRIESLITTAKSYYDVVKVLLDANANVNTKDAENRTPLLHLAAQKPETAINIPPASHLAKTVQIEQPILSLLLARADIDLEVKDKNGRTAFHWAAAKGNEILLQHLLKGTNGKKANHLTRTNRGKTALHLAAEKGHARIVSTLLENKADCNATSDGEWTALHNAAREGHAEVVGILLHWQANINAVTNHGMTPLHWASSNGHVDVVKLLLRRPDTKRHLTDDSGYSPLMLAGKNRHTAIVQYLYSSDDGSKLPNLVVRACEKHRARVTDFFPQKVGRNKFAVVKTPTIFELLYGLCPKSKKPVVSTIIEDAPSKPAFRWIHIPANNMAWVEALITKYFVQRGLEDVDEFKALSRSLNRQQHKGKTDHSVFMKPHCQRLAPLAMGVNQRRPSTLVDEKRPRDDKQTMDTSNQRGLPKASETSHPKITNDRRGSTEGRRFKNQSQWPEPLETAPESSDANHVLPQSPGTNGSSKQRKVKQPKPKPVLSKESTVVPPESRLEQHASSEDKAREDAENESPSGNIVFCMPYLHFESDKNMNEMKGCINKSIQRKGTFEDREIADMAKDELLIHAYLRDDDAPKLHLRRTLDQYYYPAINTDVRDRDQVVYKYCKKNGIEPRIFMVDQLWLWILGKDLVITSFPQRWKQPDKRTFDVLSGIVEDMYDPPVTTVYELASRIASRCSGIFYEDRHHNDYRFLDMFESFIGGLEDREPEMVMEFSDAAKKAKQWFDSLSKTEKYPKFDEYFMDIGKEMDLLAEIKDVRNELHMISTILKHQSTYLLELSGAIAEEYRIKEDSVRKEERKRKEEMKRREDLKMRGNLKKIEKLKRKGGSTTQKETDPGVNSGALDGVRSHDEMIKNEKLKMQEELKANQELRRNEEHRFQENLKALMTEKRELQNGFGEQVKAVKEHLDNVSRMDGEARDLYQSIDPLLDLKQKYAGVFEARYSRQQAVSTARQGHTIMVFTLVTIIFLPMSFMAAFFAINVKEFPRTTDGTLRLSWVLKYTLGIGLGLSLPLIIGAFTVDNIARWYNRFVGNGGGTRKWTPWLLRSYSAPEPNALVRKKSAAMGIELVTKETLFNAPPKVLRKEALCELTFRGAKRSGSIQPESWPRSESVHGRTRDRLSWASRPSPDLEQG